MMRYLKMILCGLLCLTLPFTALATNLDKVRTTPLPGTVTLTFDDGPSPVFTPKVLAILKKYHVKATFFVMGWAAKKYPKLLRQMIADGNAVASHTDSHPKLTKISQRQLLHEVVMPRDAIKAVIGKAPVCLRPPFGIGNKRVAAFIRKHGMIMVPMGFNSFDYKRPGVKKLVSWVVSNAKAGRVILLHDGYKARQQTVKALPAIIEGIRKKGLGFSAICYP
jgi:peptidoglycan-N-acetylglucosamine deacetylase